MKIIDWVKSRPDLWVGMVIVMVAFIAPFFGRWDIATFFMVWACWLDQRK